MIKLSACIAALLFFSACSNQNKNNLALIKTLKEGLDESNQTIVYQTQWLSNEFEEKTHDPIYAERALVWYPKAKHIQELSEKMIEYIKVLKQKLKEEAGFTKDNMLKEDNVNAVISVFQTNGKAKEFEEKLKSFKKDVLNTDERILRQFEKNAFLLTDSLEDGTARYQDFSQIFSSTTTISALAVLSRCENTILLLENKIVTFCKSQISGCILAIEWFSCLVNQSSSYVKKGQIIDITAGVGSISAAAQPHISINGKLVPTNENGVSIYKLKVLNEPGTYTVPVTINYTKPDGTKASEIYKVTYEVAREINESN